MPQKKQSFKALQAKWYKRLADSGFQDIEQANSPDEMLKRWDSHYFRRSIKGQQFESTQEYYYRATQWLEEYAFKNKTHKNIWTLHTEGVSLRGIARKLKQNYNSVYAIVGVIRRDMFDGNTNKAG